MHSETLFLEAPGLFYKEHPVAAYVQHGGNMAGPDPSLQLGCQKPAAVSDIGWNGILCKNSFCLQAPEVRDAQVIMSWPQRGSCEPVGPSSKARLVHEE